jgi:hypothetical protein
MSDLELLSYYVGTGNFENNVWLFGNEEGCGTYTYSDNINIRINEVKKHNKNPCYLKQLPNMESISKTSKGPVGPYVRIMRNLTPDNGEVPTLDLRPLMRQEQKIDFCEIEEYKEIIPDKKTGNLFLNSFYSTKNNQFEALAKKRIDILKKFILENKPKVIFVVGEQDKKKSLLAELIDKEGMDLINFKIESGEYEYNLSELPKTSIHRAKDYNGYFVFIYHPNYINRGIGKKKHPIAKVGPLEIYKQIVKQLLNL